MRPAPQAADKAGSVLASVACPCWPIQGRGRSGGPRKRISIPRVRVTAPPAPRHSPRGAGCAAPHGPSPGLGTLEPPRPAQGATASGDGWRGPREAVALTTAPSPWQHRGPARGGGAGATHLPPPARRWGAQGLPAPDFRGCLDRAGSGGVTGSTPFPLLGEDRVLGSQAPSQGRASTREGSGPAPGAREPRSSQDNTQHRKSEKQNRTLVKQHE